MPPENLVVVETSFHVRYVETDAMGIVHHSNYLAYFEEGRSNYSRQRGHNYADFERSGYFLTVTEVSLRYLKPAVYGQKISVLTWIAALKSRGVTFAYDVVDTETRELLVTGTTKHICITREGRVATLPESWRHWGPT